MSSGPSRSSSPRAASSGRPGAAGRSTCWCGRVRGLDPEHLERSPATVTRLPTGRRQDRAGTGVRARAGRRIRGTGGRRAPGGGTAGSELRLRETTLTMRSSYAIGRARQAPRGPAARSIAGAPACCDQAAMRRQDPLGRPKTMTGEDRRSAARCGNRTGVYCNTASYGLPPRPAWEALQAALSEWRGGRTSWEHWGAEHRGRAGRVRPAGRRRRRPGGGRRDGLRARRARSSPRCRPARGWSCPTSSSPRRCSRCSSSSASTSAPCRRRGWPRRSPTASTRSPSAPSR